MWQSSALFPGGGHRYVISPQQLPGTPGQWGGQRRGGVISSECGDLGCLGCDLGYLGFYQALPFLKAVALSKSLNLSEGVCLF